MTLIKEFEVATKDEEEIKFRNSLKQLLNADCKNLTLTEFLEGFMKDKRVV